MDNPIVLLFVIVMGVVWTVFPFVIMKRMNAMKSEMLTHTEELKLQNKTLSLMSHRVLCQLPPDHPEHTRRY